MKPIVVFPPIYELPLGLWQWCRLGEICGIVPNVASLAGIDFSPNCEELVSRFAGLVRPNKPIIESRGIVEEGSVKKKIFRFSPDGGTLFGQKVPAEMPDLPPYTSFSIELFEAGVEIHKWSLDQSFVPKGWVIDTLKAIRLGAVAATEFVKEDIRIGFSSTGKAIYLGGSSKSMLVKLPDCVR